ncbi:MAG: transglycosylase SLT domain-containing protein [Vicinamibacterales bacterium]
MTWLPLAIACSSAPKQAPVVMLATPPELPKTAQIDTPPPLPEDPVLTLLAESDRHFKAGQNELSQGHVSGAREEFDRAINVLIESPYGGRSEPRIREQFDRLVDRISTYEVRALAEGDGFTEKQYEPASLDDLLAVSATAVPPEPSPATENAVKNDPEIGQHDIPIPWDNPRVLAFIELFQGRLHDFLEEGLERGSRYLPMIQKVFHDEGLPRDLAYVPLVESAFKPNALSRTQAKGVWQFMRGTGLENGLRQDWYIDERSDPEKATVAAAKYLRTLSNMFNGDWHLALASYNGGPGRVQRAMKSSKATNFWELAANPRILPQETRDYVPMILAAIIIAGNPQQYGFEPEAEDEREVERVTLPRPTDIRLVAEWVDPTVDTIQALNPELRRWTTPIRDEAYELKVPTGTGDIVRAKLEDTSTRDLANLRWYTVKPGDTVASVARTLRVNRSDLADANYIKTTSRLKPGSKLMVPHESTVLMAARADRPAPSDSRPQASAGVVAAVGSPSTADRIKGTYRVKSGDTLGSIARVYNTSVDAIKGWNRMSSTRLQIGDTLTIYTQRRR